MKAAFCSMDESEMHLLRALGEELFMEAAQQEAVAPPPNPISKACGGPTACDVDGAAPRGCRPEKELRAKMEGKYTLRIKTSGNGLADDGYKWRKYGQKSIKNSPNPRSYYRCTNPRCNAKKQVERSVEDPETIIITYDGLHLHYTYSHFLSQQRDFPAAELHAVKKSKTIPTAPQWRQMRPTQEPQRDDGPGSQEGKGMEGLLCDGQGSQGLLEDIVPLTVRKPCSSATSSNEPSSPCQASSPSYSSYLFWPEDFDLSFLSSMV